MNERTFSHLDAKGRAAMVDVSEKPITRRVAEGTGQLILESTVIRELATLPKGDALAVARLAGIQAAKRTAELIPLAHPLGLEEVAVDLEPAADRVIIRSRVVTIARTGAEMEALTAVSVAALALYDMIKARDRTAVISAIRLEKKSGGKSGDFERQDP